MRPKSLAAMVFACALTQVACDKSSDDKFADCMNDMACRTKMQMAAGPQLFPLAQQAVATGQVPGTLPQNLQPFRVASIADAAIKAQNVKVAAAIAADDANPMSTYYKAPSPEIPKALESPSRATASTSAGPESSVAPPGAAFGEASR